LFKRLRPDGVFVSQGGVFESRCVVEIARRLNINVIGIENFMIGGMVIIDNLSGQLINRHSMAYLGREFLEVCDITKEQRKEILDMWKDKLIFKAEEHKTGGIDNSEEIKKALDIPENKKKLLLIGQVRTDASVVLDSPFFDDPVDMIEAISQCVKGFSDIMLLIRLHPKEINGKSFNGVSYDNTTWRALKERGIQSTENVRIIRESEYNTYTLMQMSDFGVTLNSQAGLEMLLFKKPVMVCANAFYGRKGFTVDLAHNKLLKSTVGLLAYDSVFTETQYELVLNYLYILYKRSLFDHNMSINQERLLQIFHPYSMV